MSRQSRVLAAIGAAGALLLVVALAVAFLSMPLSDVATVGAIVGAFVALAGFLLTQQGLRNSLGFQVTAIACIYAAAVVVSVLAVRAPGQTTGHPTALTASSTPDVSKGAVGTSALPGATLTAAPAVTHEEFKPTSKAPMQLPTPTCQVEAHTFVATPNPVKVGEVVEFIGKGYPPGSMVNIDIFQRPPFGDGHLFDVVDDLATDACGGFRYKWLVPTSYQTEGRRDVGVRAPNQHPTSDPRYRDPLVVLELLWAG